MSASQNTPYGGMQNDFYGEKEKKQRKYSQR